MPRKSLPARLWLRPAAADRAAVWVILDRGEQISTGCGKDARGEAEIRLAAHIDAKRNPVGERSRHPDQVLIGDVLSVYLDDIVPKQAKPKSAAARIGQLLDFWGERPLSEVTPATCRAYVAHRAEAEKARRAANPNAKTKPRAVSGGGARRDLEDLRAAINHHARRDLHRGLITVDLPQKSSSRTRFLTRSEVARLLWACWRHGRTVKIPRGRHKGSFVESEFHDLRHVARFILMGIYTGSRSGAIFSASIHAGANRSFVDLESGIFYRLAEGATETNKRQPPAPIPPRLLAHIRRWKAKGIIASHIVEWRGEPVASIKNAWAQAVALAELGPGVTPHTLRHTAATWLMQHGVDVWTAAGYLGMGEDMVRRVYGHHHPDHFGEAVKAITRKRRP